MADTEKPKSTDPKSSDIAEASSSDDSDWDYDYEPEVASEKSTEPDSDADFDPNFYDEEAPPEENRRKFEKYINSKKFRELHDEEDKLDNGDEDFNFPEDPEKWTEKDLREIWADPPMMKKKTGWDPNWVDNDDIEMVNEEIKAGRDPPIAPFYLPFKRSNPVIPTNHHDISTPQAVIEELDRIEEFLKWFSFIFQDGSWYEGTVWDDLAHGKGVYVAEDGLVRYEGEWFQNMMEGHGVVEVEIPDIEPIPGSKLEEKMRAQGKIIARDYMAPEDKKWLEMDIEDTLRFADGEAEVPFYENDLWIKEFGKKPEKGRYRYAGEWKHGRMHGCGVYEVNERTIYGRFYFGELLKDDPYDCDAKQCALHSGIAEVAAAKARMFINKPDGMVREQWGPFNDPQHPYLYEEEDVWMAPGFINQFYEVPDLWKKYVKDVDEEREMWLNSFYRAPLRLPMPAELSYWWENEEKPEFVLVNKKPEPDPEDPSRLVYTDDPLILHTPTGQYINYVEDEKYGIRLFWQPVLKEGEEVDPDKIAFLPLGNEKLDRGKNVFMRFLSKVQDKWAAIGEKIDKWTEEKKREVETKIKLIEKQLELVDAELDLKEAIEDFDEELKRLGNVQDVKTNKKKEKKMEIEIEKKVEKGFEGKEDKVPHEVLSQSEKTISAEKEEEEDDDEEDEDEDEDEEEDEDEGTGSSFGSVMDGEDLSKDDQKGKGNKGGSSPFAASSLSFATRSLVSMIPSQLQLSFSKWKEMKSRLKIPLSSSPPVTKMRTSPCSISFTPEGDRGLTLRTVHRTNLIGKPITTPRPRNRSTLKESMKSRGSVWHRAPPRNELNVLSLHTQINTSLL